MAYVEKKDNEDFEYLYKRFKKKVNDEKILKEFKKHSHFMTDLEKRKMKEKDRMKKLKRKKDLYVNQG